MLTNVFENCHFIFMGGKNLPENSVITAIEVTAMTLKVALKFMHYIHLTSPIIEGILIDKGTEKLFLLIKDSHVKQVKDELLNAKKQDYPHYTYQHLLPFIWKETYHF